MTLVLFSDNKIESLKSEFFKGIDADILMPFRDNFCTALGELDVNSMIVNELTNFDRQKFSVITKDLVVFFTKFRDYPPQGMLNLTSIILEFVKAVLRHPEARQSEKEFMGHLLLKYRSQFYEHFDRLNSQETAEGPESLREKKDIEFATLQLTKSLGQLLHDTSYFEVEREVLMTTTCCRLVFDSFKREIEVNKGDPSKLCRLLAEYGMFAGKCDKKELARECYERAEEQATCYDEVESIQRLIVSLEKPMEEEEDDNAHLKRVYRHILCMPFTPDCLSGEADGGRGGR